MIKRFCYLSTLIFLFGLCFIRSAYATEQGHYFPGAASIRDIIMPKKQGLYFAQFNTFAFSESFYGQNGKEIKELGPDAVFNYMGYDADAEGGGYFAMSGFQFATSPTFAWVTELGLLGANYGIVISPTFGYIEGKIRIGDSVIKQSDSGLADLYVQPVWLGWSGDYYDFMVGYAFFAPTGRYDNDRLANMGLGFWSHDLTLTSALYLDKAQKTAFVLNTTYEFNMKKSQIDVRPGDDLCLEYGISQMLNKHLEIGVSGSSIWQVTDDKGSDVTYQDIKDYAHAVGCELSYSMFNDKMSIVVRYMLDYAVKERFKGQLFAANLSYDF